MRINAKRQMIIDECRTWLETPFVHQARIKGVACDCAALPIAAAARIGMQPQDIKGYGRIPHADQLRQCVAGQLIKIKIDAAQPGDVYLMRFAGAEQHLAIKTDYGIIHCYSQLSENGKQAGRVVEHRLNEQWRRRIMSAYKFPGVD